MNQKQRRPRTKVRRGIYVLPNLFTTMNIFCGFYAVISCINGGFVPAAWAIIIAAVFDNLDGKIARATNTTSQFGVEYDSLADLISFGLAPGLMMYLWALKPLGRIGWLAAFLFMVCGALRLARFNTQSGTVSGDFFSGLPIPAAAGMNAVIILICHRFGVGGDASPIMVLITLYTLSFLMVSTIKYNSFKKFELFRRMNFNVLVIAILFLIFIAAQPSIALFSIGLVYVLSGPLTSLKRYRKLKAKRSKSIDPDKQESKPI